MRARLHVHDASTREPERAARQISEELLPGFPRRRPVSLALVVHGPHPGLTPTPWVVGGILAALHEAGRTPARVLTIGDHDTADALLRKATREAPVPFEQLVARPNRDRKLALRVDGAQRPLSLIRELVGSSLILCAPLCFDARESGSERQWSGPLASALAALARGRGFTPARAKLARGLRPRQDERGARAELDAGLELLRASFASCALVLDGTWAAALAAAATPASSRAVTGARPRGPDGRFVGLGRAPSTASEPDLPTLLGELAAPDRILALDELGRRDLSALLDIDRWLVSALGLGPRGASRSTLELTRSPGRWPQLSPTAPRAQPSRLADRAIASIRDQSRRLRPAPAQAALPARVPGEFAQLWTRRWYGEHALGPQSPSSLSLGPR